MSCKKVIVETTVKLLKPLILTAFWSKFWIFSKNGKKLSLGPLHALYLKNHKNNPRVMKLSELAYEYAY